MTTLTEKESDALLLIFRDFTRIYNANSISRELGITPRGALKLLKRLQEERVLVSREYGHAAFYKANLEDAYAQKLIETLLIKESRDAAPRWIEEFKEVYPHAHIALIFGSVLRDDKKAKDIDLLLVFDKEEFKNVMKLLDKRKAILPKPIHDLTMTLSDLKTNLMKRNPAMVSAVKHGCILHGYGTFVEVIKQVQNSQGVFGIPEPGEQ